MSGEFINLKVVDTLEYFKPKADRYPRCDKDGRNEMHAVREIRAITFIKWADPRACEKYTWDSKGIYLLYDQGDEKGPWTVRLHGKPMLVMHRYMRVGDTAIGEGIFRRYDRQCNLINRRWHKVVRELYKIYDQFDCGGDIGIQPVIVVKQNNERYYYAKGWGWFRWDLYQDRVLVAQVEFNYLGGPAVIPAPYCNLEEK